MNGFGLIRAVWCYNILIHVVKLHCNMVNLHQNFTLEWTCKDILCNVMISNYILMFSTFTKIAIQNLHVTRHLRCVIIMLSSS